MKYLKLFAFFYLAILKFAFSQITNPPALISQRDGLDIKNNGDRVDRLIYEFKLKDKHSTTDDVKFVLEKNNSFRDIKDVLERFEEYIDSLSQVQIPSDIYLNQMIDNQKVLENHLNFLLKNQTSLYGYTDTSNQILKSINLSHDNDILMLSTLNEDRDYTGGFRLEFTTDYLKMRVFKFWNTDNILTYQSLFIGGEGYTPYIRFTNSEVENAMNIKLEMSANTGYFTQSSRDVITKYLRFRQVHTDRPFGSFQYIARGKYRLDSYGRWRSKSYFKLGTIGGTLEEKLQELIHKDIDKGSLRVLNWEDQIANGGRTAFNIDHYIDIMLLSSESTIYKKDGLGPKKWPNFVNIYVPVEFHTGTEIDAVGTGIGISNRTLKQRSGNNDLRNNLTLSNACKIKNLYDKLFFSYELRYRKIIHNTMLEGFGWFKTWEDDPLDEDVLTKYNLRYHEVTRNLFTTEFFLGFRFKKGSFYYVKTLNRNKEFQKRIMYDNNPNSAGKSTYGWGKIGLNFFI